MNAYLVGKDKFCVVLPDKTDVAKQPKLRSIHMVRQ